MPYGRALPIEASVEERCAGHTAREAEVAGVPVDDRADVQAHLRVRRQVVGELADEALGIDAPGGQPGARGGEPVPPRHGRLDLVPPGAVDAALEQREERAQRLAGVADEPDLDGISPADAPAVESICTARACPGSG